MTNETVYWSNPIAEDGAVARMFRESLITTTAMDVLPCVFGCRSRRRAIQVWFGTYPVVPRDGCPEARPPRLSPPQAYDGGQARPSSWSGDSNS